MKFYALLLYQYPEKFSTRQTVPTNCVLCNDPIGLVEAPAICIDCGEAIRESDHVGLISRINREHKS